VTKHTARRKRRRRKAQLKNPASVRPHMEIAGRTGSGHYIRRPPGKAAINRPGPTAYSMAQGGAAAGAAPTAPTRGNHRLPTDIRT